MEQSEGVAAKRRVLVDALTMCFERSKVREHVNGDTLRTVLNSAMGEMWREGELRLDTVWKILTQQPGLSAQEVAPPLLVFKAYEDELGVIVRLPQALAAIPRSEQVRLRDELKISKADFAKSVGELQSIAKTEQAEKQAAVVAQVEKEKSSRLEKPAEVRTPTAGHAAVKKPLPKGMAAAIMAIALIICGGTVYVSLRSNAEPADFSDVTPMLKIEGGEKGGGAWSGVITDPKWDKLSAEEKEKLAAQLFDHEIGKGVQALTLRDSSGEVRVTATNLGGKKTIAAH